MEIAATEIETKLNLREWANWKRNMYLTGGYDPNDYHKLSDYQRKWTADTLVTLKEFNKN